MANLFPQILAAAVDERAHNIFYRQTQLERLCSSLITRIPDIREAIAEDYGHSPAEVALEIHLVLEAVKREYASLQPSKAHEEEYLIAAGKDAPSRTRPAGIVYIEPCTHSLFYSVVVPLAAATAAGNCVIVLLENNIRTLSSLLRQILSSALAQDTFAIVSSAIRDESLLNSAIFVDQNSTAKWPKANELASAAATRTIAVVDRTADVQLAAHELVAARFSFRGRSAYAPDCVLVNEFVKHAFLQAVVSECAKLGGVAPITGDEKSMRGGAADKVQEQVSSLREADPGVRVILQEHKMAVVDLPSRTSHFLAKKLDAPVLMVHAITSLDDAIDLISSTEDGPCLAAYHFGNPAQAKYLTQFIDANISFINHIPREVLIGPAYPTGHPINLAARYPRELFTLQRPAYIERRSAPAVFDAALTSSSNATAQQLLRDASSPLKVLKRSKGGGVGFFEQGFLMNAAILLTTTISVSGFGIYWWVRRGRSPW
ncbi:hypothetical protein LTR36_006818 [Oleoguttula mirabilis]|uniref:Aldehyde dehydrogenase domain-containing protein n=1 Tax=Oleoguttula mirabilis TaxID=1507867 RepID=A0AAV9JB28_9PEZI|nr:hypothetical protein LTR36_006818 [Oleoguttula mirabilis]